MHGGTAKTRSTSTRTSNVAAEIRTKHFFITVRSFPLYKSTTFIFLSELAHWLWLSTRAIVLTAVLNKAYCGIMHLRHNPSPRGPPSPPCWRHYHVIILLARYRAECINGATEITEIPFSLMLQALNISQRAPQQGARPFLRKPRNVTAWTRIQNHLLMKRISSLGYLHYVKNLYQTG
jgi:hypothetical protein